MTDFQVAIWLSIVLVISVFFICVAIFCVFLKQSDSMHALQKIGFALLVFGLVVQVIRSSHYLQFGSYPVDQYFPLWITKDVGICVLIYYYSFVFPKAKDAKT